METRGLTNRKNLLIAAAAVAAGTAATYWLRHPKAKPHDPLPTAPLVDLNQYMGEWFEVARLPVSYEENCVGTKAIYTMQPDGSVRILNTCHKGGLDGPLKVAKGRATVADRQRKSKLKVSFFWPFTGDYYILEVGNGYEYALVGDPSREHLWVLSRTPQMELQLLHNLVAKAQRLGFNTGRLIYTVQPGGRSVG
jgi:apolipoprotein D and lipocalin family protein